MQGASVPAPVGRVVQAVCLQLHFLHLCTVLVKVTNGLHIADSSSHPGFIPHHTWISSCFQHTLSLQPQTLSCLGHAILLLSQGPLPLSFFYYSPASPAPFPFLCSAWGSHFAHLLLCIYTPMILSRFIT